VDAVPRTIRAEILISSTAHFANINFGKPFGEHHRLQ